MRIIAAALMVLLDALVAGLDNGLARTPPMGWMAWERFRCTTDCSTPYGCVNETLFQQHIDILAQPEWASLGYAYVNIDDCWPAMSRSAGDNTIQADPTRFPSGIRKLADYAHAKKVKLGIYNDVGTKTCGGYPGICADEQCGPAPPSFFAADAKTYAVDYEIDRIKMDGCNSNHTQPVLNAAYSFFGEQLNASGRPVLYSCSWPDYLRTAGKGLEGVPLDLIAQKCNIWRMYDDVQDSWASVTNIVDWCGDNQDELIKVAGPGRFNDPDMLIIGNYALSVEQSKAQMALWSIMAAPLYMGNDLRRLDPELKAILQAKEVIAVDQDALGVQGKRIVHNTTNGYTLGDVWVKDLANGDVAVVLWNRCTYGTPRTMAVSWEQIGAGGADDSAAVRDLFAEKDVGVFKGGYATQVNIDGVVMLRVSTGSPAAAASRLPGKK